MHIMVSFDPNDVWDTLLPFGQYVAEHSAQTSSLVNFDCKHQISNITEIRSVISKIDFRNDIFFPLKIYVYSVENNSKIHVNFMR